MNVWMAGTNQMAVVGLAALLNTLWYAAAVVGLTWAALRFLQRVNAATRYWIWTAVLAFLVILPFLPALVSRLETAGAPATVAPLATVAAAPEVVHQHLAPVTLMLDSTPGPNHWPLYLLALWMVIAGWQLFLLLRGVVSVRRLKAHAKAAPGAAMTIELRRRAEVLASDEISSPVAVGYIHPAVILPTGLPASLDEGEMQDVLLHELAHLARFDDWLNLASRMLGAILVLHPLAGVVLKQIEREREMACDDFVVAHTGSAKSYARSLARLHDLRTSTGTRLLAPALLGRKVSLADRIESLLRCGRKFSARPSLANLSVSALLLVLLLGTGGLMPGWLAIAQTKGTSRPSFEVASIKLSNSRQGAPIGLFVYPGGRIRASLCTFKYLVMNAFDVQSFQISGGPRWVDHTRYNIDAIAPPSSQVRKWTPPSFKAPLNAKERQMLQSLLMDRFHLKFHWEKKVGHVYFLTMGKRELNLRPAKDKHDYPWAGSVEGGAINGDGIAGDNVSMPQLAARLSGYLDRPVLDKTGLNGSYDFRYRYSSNPSNLDIDSCIFTSIRELGLKLKAGKGPVRTIVIDHVEHPTPN